MQDNKMLQTVYTFFLGLLLAIFIGVGISTFYTGPKMPEWPSALNSYGKNLTQEQENLQKQFDAQMETYNKKSKPYNRNVSIIALSSSVVLMVISLAFEKKIKIIADGVLLGGVFTLLYSLGRGFAADDTKYNFAVVSVGLIVALYLGYHRFIRVSVNTKKG